MSELAWVAVGWAGWYVLGCGVLAAIDDQQESLRLWARSGPFGRNGVGVVVMLWPVVWWMARRSRVLRGEDRSLDASGPGGGENSPRDNK